MIKTTTFLSSLKAYEPGKSVESVASQTGLDQIVKLASNENPLGISPMALKAVEQTLMNSNRYPDPSGSELVAKLAEKHNVAPERIILGAGVDSLLGYIINAFSTPNQTVLTSEVTFTGIFVHTQKYGRQLDLVPLKEYRHDLKAMADSITPSTKIIYLANPNNPTGTIITKTELESFMERVSSDILVIIDEAYYSYACRDAEYPDSLSLNYDNLLITRTFSKDYGLAGLRVGYAVGAPELIRALYKIRLPFEPSYPAQQAALAALDDDEFLSRSIVQSEQSLKRIGEAFDALGIKHLPSWANFLLVLFPSQKLASAFAAECLNRGLILRPTETFGLAQGVRINSGTDAETDFAIKIIKEVARRVAGLCTTQA